jgi:hypothetical protein
MTNGAHVWYPQDNPLEGNPDSADVLAILRSLHTDRPWSDEFLSADDVKTLHKDGE